MGSTVMLIKPPGPGHLLWQINWERKSVECLKSDKRSFPTNGALTERHLWWMSESQK